MIGHHLYRTDILLMDIVGGDGIAAAEHIMSFDIKLVDCLAVIFDFSLIRHLHSRHLLQDISQTLVVGIGKACHIVGDGIASLPDAWSLHHNILQLCSLLRQEHMINSSILRQRNGFHSISHHREMQHVTTIRNSIERQQETSICLCLGKLQDSIAGSRSDGNHHSLQPVARIGIFHLTRQGDLLGIGQSAHTDKPQI